MRQLEKEEDYEWQEEQEEEVGGDTAPYYQEIQDSLDFDATKKKALRSRIKLIMNWLETEWWLGGRARVSK